MKKLLFLSKGEDSSATRYRALQFFPRFREAGWTVEHLSASGGLPTWGRLLAAAAAADVVVVLRKTFPAPLHWLLRRCARRLVFDFDDAIFCNSNGSPSPTRMQRFARMIAACDHVFAGNGFLAAQAARFNPAVTLLPTAVEVERYAQAASRADGEHVDAVWIGSSSTRKYLVEALPALRLAAQREPRLRLKIIADFDLPDAGLPTLAVRWQADTEAAELASAHFGIAPMRDDDWSRGKCALKVLQYMAAGLPVVSSNCGANAEIVVDGQTGYLVDDDAAWAARMVELAGDAGRCAAMGEAGRQRALAGYDLVPVFATMNRQLEALLR